MPVIVLYLLKLSISLSAVWLFYQVLLRRLTFYNLNRWYLLFYSLLSFFIPLIDIAPMVEEKGDAQPIVVSLIPAIVDSTPAVPMVNRDHVMLPDGWSVLLGVILLGSILLLTRLVISWMALRRIRRGSEPAGYGRTKVYQVDASIAPFSFGNAVFINKTLHTERELEEILVHERVHIRQRHTVDIVLAELFLIVNWYNPFVWLIRRSIRQNLEFIADGQMLEKGYDRKVYQYHLLKVSGQSPYRLANNFNFSSLKKRIIMMNRIQSARVHLVKFIFIVPLLGVLLVAFRDKVSPHVSMDTDTGSVRASSRAIALKPDTSGPLYILNEVEISEAELKSLDPNAIGWINVLKDSEASAFGVAGVNGVVLIYTKNYVKRGEVRLKNSKRIKVESRDMTVAEKNKLRLALEDTSSASVELRIRNGQITRGANRDTSKMDLMLKDRNSVDQLRKCLYIVDGVELSYEDVGKMDQNRIASINVLKGQAAQAIYGSKGKYGAIIITTKGPTFTGPVTLTTIEKGDTMKLIADTIRFKLPPPVKTTNK